jgi:hypothetical protein
MISIAIGGALNGTGSATGAINFADEVDRYNIVLRGGELYEFQANSTNSRDPTLTLNRLLWGLYVPGCFYTQTWALKLLSPPGEHGAGSFLATPINCSAMMRVEPRCRSPASQTGSKHNL